MYTLNAPEITLVVGGDSTGGSAETNPIPPGNVSSYYLWLHLPHPPIIGGPIHVPTIPMTSQ